MFQTFRIHHPPLDRIILYDSVRPFTELDGAVVIHLESYGDNYLEVVVLGVPLDLTPAFVLNCPEIPDS